jgi:long-chain acyl-CoA synthetase
MKTLTDILKNSAQKFGDRPALIMRMGYRTLKLSYRDIYELAKKIACFLRKNGLQKGDAVLLLAPNSPYWICVWWGCLLEGCIPVPLNIQSTSETVERIAEQTGAKALFKFLHYKQKLPARLKIYDIEFMQEFLEGIENAQFSSEAGAGENDIAELMYTSGTTGDPKGVILTHKNLLSNLETLASLVVISEKDVFLSVLPLSHIFEQMAGFLFPFSRGAVIVYAHSPIAIRSLLKEYRVTHMIAVPEFLRIIMDKIEAASGALLRLSLKIQNKRIRKILFWPVRRNLGRRLQTVASGGASLDPELEKKWDALGINLLQGYGLTETSPIISTNTYGERCIGSVGKILPNVKVKIAPDGEIWVKGPNVFQGYFKNKEKTKETFTADGWFKTGDIGELDQNGFLYIKGRKKYMILGPGGQNVYPEDIEFELNKLADVSDSAVVGLEKPGGAVEIHAVLLFKKEVEANIESIVKKANQKLASYQQIQGWSAWPKDDFPRSATKKVKKEEVLKWLRSRKEPAFAKAVADEIKTPLIRLLAEITGRDISEINAKTRLVPELNLDSLLRVELVARIEEKFGAIIDEAAIAPATSVADLEKMVKDQKPAPPISLFKKWPRLRWISWIRTLGQIFLVFPLFRIFMEVKIEGAENLRDLRLPAVFMPNHTSYLDSFAVLRALPFYIRKRAAFAAAQDVLYKYKSIGILGELFLNAFPFPRQEYENIKAGLECMGKLLDWQFSVVIYPEGKISLSGKLQSLKRGAGLIAVEMDASIVPVKIIGANAIMPDRKWFPRKRRGIVVVKFGKPIKFKKSDSYIETTEKLQEVIKNL